MLAYQDKGCSGSNNTVYFVRFRAIVYLAVSVSPRKTGLQYCIQKRTTNKKEQRECSKNGVRRAQSARRTPFFVVVQHMIFGCSLYNTVLVAQTGFIHLVSPKQMQ